MNATALIDSLERFATALPGVVAQLPVEDARWKPPDGAWSVLEVLRHLGDEEVEDFRQRLRLTLEEPGAPWPPIDPPGWAIQRRYNEANPAEALETFLTERRASLRWLRGLGAVDWSTVYDHPQLGQIRAGDLLAAWTAHDTLHLRQISKRLYQITRRNAGDYNTDYAGGWGA